MHFPRTFASSMALALACNALAQSTYVFNPHYAVIPGDPEPRTFLWSDARNWGGGLPGSTDTVVVNEYSELTGSFTVGSARIVDQMVAGAGGSLEVLNNFRADGVVTLFNQLTLRGQSQFGLTDTTGTLVSFYGDVDNYGDAVVYSTHGTAFSMVGGVGSQPVVTNHTGASFLFGATQIGGAYSGFVNQAGATLTKTGSGNATLVASLSQPDGSFRRAFDHHGQLNVLGGKLTLDASAGDWDGGGVTLRTTPPWTSISVSRAAKSRSTAPAPSPGWAATWPATSPSISPPTARSSSMGSTPTTSTTTSRSTDRSPSETATSPAPMAASSCGARPPSRCPPPMGSI